MAKRGWNVSGRVVRDESDVRAAMRAVYGSDAVWVEAAPGGTDGAHDVVLHSGSQAVSAELKAWGRDKSGRIVAKLRRSQVRLHCIAAQRGWASVLVFGVIGEPDLWVLPSSRVPRDVLAHLPADAGTPLPLLAGTMPSEADASAVRGVLQAVARWNGCGATPGPMTPVGGLPTAF